MNRLILIIFVCFIFAGLSAAQKGRAPRDYLRYYETPADTWTGWVASVNEETREFTLTYRSKGKEETFVGVLSKDYPVKFPGSNREIKLADLMGLDRRVRAYYVTRTQKVNDHKVKINEVFKLAFLRRLRPR